MIEADHWGVAHGYHDIRGAWVPASEIGTRAALSAMRAEAGGPPDTTTWVVSTTESVNLPRPAVLLTEDGGEQALAPGPLTGVAAGYHRLQFEDGEVALVVSPGYCPLPERRMWGWAVQLYAMRSARSWGIGDLGDLARLAAWSGAEGAGLVLTNPLHAVAPTEHVEPSPYFPSSRRWRNPLYLSVEDVPGADALGTALGELATTARRLNADRRIDRDAAWAHKRAALELIFDRRGPEPAFDRWAEEQGVSLQTFATYCALSERHGGDWRAWPTELRRPSSPAVHREVDALRERVRFHAWLQWLLDVQLRKAGTQGPVLLTDLAIGADAGGADAWEWQDVVAEGVTIGAPPDEFSPAGQDWGFPPFDPWRLRAAGYAPFVSVLRAAFRHAGGVRVDHVAGLFRQFWVPGDGAAADGVYVRLPWHDLCLIVGLEAHRAGAFVVGEDLGTLEDWVRVELGRRNLLSYKLLWFEDDPPEEWAPGALAAVTTHDLPTIAGLLSCGDAAERAALGLSVDADADDGLRRRLTRATGAVGETNVGVTTVAAYRALGASPCVLAAATLDDALGVTERPNLPGTTDERPNWSLALSSPLEAIERDPQVRAVAVALAETRPAPD